MSTLSFVLLQNIGFMHLKLCLLSVLVLALGDHGHRKRVSHLHFIPLQNQPVLRAPLVVRDVPVVGAVVVSGPSWAVAGYWR